MSITPKRQAELHIAAFTHEDTLASSITLPLEILTGAAQALGRSSSQPLNFSCFSTEGGALALGSGLSLGTCPLSEFEDADLLIVPAIWRQPQRVLRRDAEQIEIIKKHIEADRLTVSVGSGSFLLAETGAMHGRSMTTHWQWFDAFARRYPSVNLERRQLITQSKAVFCVGSVNSVADLMIYLCGEIFSQRAARHIESQFSPEIRQRFSPSPLGSSRDLHPDELVADAQSEVIKDLRAPLCISKLASMLEISSRTLTRRFKSATGVTISTYLRERRLDEAQSLLRRTNLSVTEVGNTVGHADPSHFARTFRKQTGLTPTAYRALVRQKAFEVAERTT